MTELANTLATQVSTILNATWQTRAGRVIPGTDDVALANGGVTLDAVVLYADLAGSTKLARTFPDKVAAKVVRAYLSSMTRLVTASSGSVRSFDGDRVMGVFVGDSKNSNAAKCALKMNYVLTKVLRPKISTAFPSLAQKGFTLDHCVGIARSEMLVVRGGVRGSNDLVFVGSAPNIAAKLSEIRNGNWNTYVTWKVYKHLDRAAKIGADGNNMWTGRVTRTLGDEKWELYKSNWTWKP